LLRASLKLLIVFSTELFKSDSVRKERKAGKAKAIKIAKIPITIRISTRVKPLTPLENCLFLYAIVILLLSPVDSVISNGVHIITLR